VSGEIPVSVNDLCAIGGVNRRTLEYAFDEIFGSSSKQFLKAEKLNVARQDFLDAGPVTDSVASIAETHRSSDLGQFATFPYSG